MYYTLRPMVTSLLKNGRNLFLRRQTGILSAAFIIMVAYAASGLLGVFRNRLLAQRFFSGQEAQLDAYFAAFVLPDTVFQLLVLGALSAAFIPVFTEYLHKDKQEAWRIASTSMTGILITFLFISIILFIFAPFAARALVPNFSPDLLQTTAILIRIMLVAQFFFALSSFMTGILQSHHRFLLSATAPIVYNISIIAGIIMLSPILGIYGPAIGVVIGAFLHFAIQFPVARRLGFRFHLTTKFSHPGVRRIFRLMPARAATLVIGQQLDKLVAVIVSSALAAGTIAIFNFARQLYVLPITVFGATVGQASFPMLSHAKEDGKERFTSLIAATLLQLFFFTFPAAVLLLVLRIPAVRLSFGSKQFPWEATILTGKAVALFALSIPAQSANQLLTRCFYAAQNTKIPLITTAVSSIIMVILAWGLGSYLHTGILGVVVAIVISDIVNFFLLMSLLESKIASGLMKMIIVPVAKIAFVTALTGIGLWIPMKLLDTFVFDTTRTLPLVGLTTLVVTIGLVIFLVLSKLLNIEQLDSLGKLLRRLGEWKKVLKESEEVLEPQGADAY